MLLIFFLFQVSKEVSLENFKCLSHHHIRTKSERAITMHDVSVSLALSSVVFSRDSAEVERHCCTIGYLWEGQTS